MLAPVRAARKVGTVFLIGGIATTAIFAPVMALVALVGAALSAFGRLSQVSVAETKRRSLGRVWDMFGVYSTVMAVLCGVTVVLSFLLARPALIGPVIAFTVLTCWVPFVVHLTKRKG